MAGSVLVLVLSQTAMAYGGPGAGLSAIGSAIALIVGVFLTFLGFIWYPIKRLIRRLRPAKEPPAEERFTNDGAP